RSGGDRRSIAADPRREGQYPRTRTAGCRRDDAGRAEQPRMNITGLFIRRQVMTTLVMLGVLIFGMIAYTKLPVSDLPNVDYPTINVNASLPGASPETMAAAVATPLEK